MSTPCPRLSNRCSKQFGGESESGAMGVETITKTREDRLAKARLSLVTAEKTMGVSPTVSLTAGRVWHVESGNAALFEALLEMRESGQWIGFIGVKNLGWLAAEEKGIPLGKTLVVPRVGENALKVVAALIDGVDLIAAGPLPLTPQNQRALAGRARARKTTIVTTVPWTAISKPWKSAEGYGNLERKVG